MNQIAKEDPGPRTLGNTSRSAGKNQTEPTVQVEDKQIRTCNRASEGPSNIPRKIKESTLNYVKDPTVT